MLIKGMKGWDGFTISFVAAGMGRLSLDLLQPVKNIVGYGSVWNLQSHADVRWKLYDYII